MKKVNQSKRSLDETPHLTELVNHGRTYKGIKSLIEDENEEVRKKEHKELKRDDLKAPSYEDSHTHFKYW